MRIQGHKHHALHFYNFQMYQIIKAFKMIQFYMLNNLTFYYFPIEYFWHFCKSKGQRDREALLLEIDGISPIVQSPNVIIQIAKVHPSYKRKFSQIENHNYCETVTDRSLFCCFIIIKKKCQELLLQRDVNNKVSLRKLLLSFPTVLSFPMTTLLTSCS